MSGGMKKSPRPRSAATLPGSRRWNEHLHVTARLSTTTILLYSAACFSTSKETPFLCNENGQARAGAERLHAEKPVKIKGTAMAHGVGRSWGTPDGNVFQRRCRAIETWRALFDFPAKQAPSVSFPPLNRRRLRRGLNIRGGG